jgi:hypothetical protein
MERRAGINRPSAYKKRRRSNPITGLDRPEGSRRLRPPDFKTIA